MKLISFFSWDGEKRKYFVCFFLLVLQTRIGKNNKNCLSFTNKLIANRLKLNLNLINFGTEID